MELISDEVSPQSQLLFGNFHILWIINNCHWHQIVCLIIEVHISPCYVDENCQVSILQPFAHFNTDSESKSSFWLTLKSTWKISISIFELEYGVVCYTREEEYIWLGSEKKMIQLAVVVSDSENSPGWRSIRSLAIQILAPGTPQHPYLNNKVIFLYPDPINF